MGVGVWVDGDGGAWGVEGGATRGAVHRRRCRRRRRDSPTVASIVDIHRTKTF